MHVHVRVHAKLRAPVDFDDISTFDITYFEHLGGGGDSDVELVVRGEFHSTPSRLMGY